MSHEPQRAANLPRILLGFALITALPLAIFFLIGDTPLPLTLASAAVAFGGGILASGIGPRGHATGAWVAGYFAFGAWSFALAFAGYFSTCDWLAAVDLGVTFATGLFVIVRIYRVTRLPFLAAHALLLGVVLSLCYFGGWNVRVFSDFEV